MEQSENGPQPEGNLRHQVIEWLRQSSEDTELDEESQEQAHHYLVQVQQKSLSKQALGQLLRHYIHFDVEEARKQTAEPADLYLRIVTKRLSENQDASDLLNYLLTEEYIPLQQETAEVLANRFSRSELDLGNCRDILLRLLAEHDPPFTTETIKSFQATTAELEDILFYNIKPYWDALAPDLVEHQDEEVVYGQIIAELDQLPVLYPELSRESRLEIDQCKSALEGRIIPEIWNFLKVIDEIDRLEQDLGLSGTMVFRVRIIDRICALEDKHERQQLIQQIDERSGDSK